MLKWTLQKSKRNHHLESIRTTKQLNKRRPHNITGKVLTKPATNTIIESSLKSEYTKNKLKISIPISIDTDRSNTTRATAKMTTATIERHFRRSSFGGNDINLHRRSLTTIAADSNKENLGIFFARSPTGNTSLNALQNLSNGKSPNRLTTPMPMRRRTIAAAQVNIKRVSEEFESTAAPTVTEFDDTETLNQIQFRSFHREESLSSSRMGDTTLDKMLDAIIESARLEVKCQNVEVKQRESSPPPRSLLSDCEFEDSIHEMEVCTPTHLKRQRVVRRKNNQRSMRNENRNNNRKQEMIGLTLPNGIPSPETPKNKATTSTAASIATSYNYLAAVETPQNFIFIIDSSLPKNFPKDVQRCSTPTVEQAQSIKRCLSFSPNSDEEELKDAKRSSVALSIVSSEGVSSPGRSSRSLTMPVKGSLDLAIFIDNTRLNVHVIRCRDLQRANGSTSLNAYVKVTLIRFKPPVDANGIENSFQRTAVHRHSSRPYFDHRFVFDLQRKDSGIRMKPLEFKAGERVQLAVWHRDRQNKRSEFLGCMSFPLCNVAQRPINGSYKLQSQSCLNNPIPAILATTTTTTTTISAVPRNHLNEMATLRQQKSEEDVISIDSMTAASMNLIDAQTNQPVALSKKALHQRDADENLFLRFLELDPPGDATGRQPNKPVVGRTPFTVTKRLTRTVDRGFGFSIVWTHPPRVEKVEPGLSADRNGIQPGDYVIFVDKHNVVTMPESDVLNLIRSQGNNLTMEIFRRSHTGSVATSIGRSSTVMNGGGGVGIIGKTAGTSYQKNSRLTSVSSNYTASEMSPAPKFQPMPSNLRPGISSIEAAKKRLNLPQVTFSKESIAPITDNRRRFLLQLISREQNFISALLFGMQRFVQPLSTRKDLISPNDHRTLFQNIDELLRLSEDILEQLCHDSQEPQMNFTSRVYLSKTNAICAAYKKYCNGIKRADCVLVNKSRQAGSEFVSFITEPQVPRKCPDLTMFIHRPLQHFREILKLMQLLASNCHVDSEEHRNFTSVINELQAAYREITVTSGLMEPLGEGRPLLTLQDLESRMVFTKCKPFTLAVQGRQWIFGGDLSRVEGRSVKPYWTLLFSDIIVFAKVSRDRVLFITEEPVPIANIVDSCFHMRKKTTEFRLTVDPNGRLAESPTGYCAPDLTRTPKKSARRKSLILRAPSLELKAVWQNLLQRQIFLVNAALGSTPLSSPLDSPDVLNTLVPLSDIGMASASIGSVKHSSLDCINLKNQQQVRSIRNNKTEIESGSYENLQRLASNLASRCSSRMTQTTNTSMSTRSVATGPTTTTNDSTTSLRSIVMNRRHLLSQMGSSPLPLNRHTAISANSSTWLSLSGSSINTNTTTLGGGGGIGGSVGVVGITAASVEHLTSCKCLTAIPEALSESQENSTPNYEKKIILHHCNNRILDDDNNGDDDDDVDTNDIRHPLACLNDNGNGHRMGVLAKSNLSGMLEFSLSSVGRSFIDESDLLGTTRSQNNSIATPETPTPNISPTSSSTTTTTRPSDTFSNDFVLHTRTTSMDIKDRRHNLSKQSNAIPLAQFGGSWDLLELDLDLHEVNLDPCYGPDVAECVFLDDTDDNDDNDNRSEIEIFIDPFGILPTEPTPPDSLDL